MKYPYYFWVEQKGVSRTPPLFDKHSFKELRVKTHPGQEARLYSTNRKLVKDI